MKLKDTLLMPKTKFDMRAKLATREPMFQKKWEEEQVYKNVLKKNEGKKQFLLHDGPPYANGDLHSGHAMNKILKDFIVRYKNMSGFYAPVIMGWDTHGLPIETALLKKGKVKRDRLTVNEFRDACKDYALKQVSNQKDQFFSLGLMADKEDYYVTLDEKYEAEQIRVFGKMAEAGLIFKGLKPVYWSPTSQSALAEAEIEYQDKVSPAIYVGMDMIENETFADTQIVIWTTTPWTIPANLGVAVGAEFMYSHIQTPDKKYIVASDLVESFVEALEISEYSVLNEYQGSDLEMIKLQHPLFSERQTIIMLADHVTVESGTGCVHTAPGHGEDDFIVGKKYGLEVISVVNAYGKMNEFAGKYEGMFYEDANKEIGQDLEASGHLLKLNFIKHSYPHDWRTKKPVMFRATAQWFAHIDPVKGELLEAINNVDWINEWGRVRLYNMIEGRNEWCISRQRKWGVPIPIFYAENDEPIFDQDLIEHVASLFEEHGSNIWFEKEAKELLPEGYTHPNSPNGLFTKEEDIMDVWFDSGTSHTAVSEKRLNQYQADLYLEGSDQYRGWFNSSLITGYISHNEAPYKSVLSHGFVLDGKGNKMSKSLGNTIVPKEITGTKGADILRLWVASSDYQNDVRISAEILVQVSEIYRRMRNTTRFMIGNLSDFDRNTDLLSYSELHEIDQYMMIRLDEVITDVKAAYDKYEFKRVVDIINNYITLELSSFYMDFIKDIIYIEAKENVRRRQIQSVLFYHVDALLKMLTPIIPHTTYEAFGYISDEIVFMQDFPEIGGYKDEAIKAKFEKFMEIRQEVNKAIENKRNEKVIGKSLESMLTINLDSESMEVLRTIEDLDILFIVSKVVLTEEAITGFTSELGTIKVEKYEHIECPRCRKYYEEKEFTNVIVGEEEHNLCNKCCKVVKTYL